MRLDDVPIDSFHKAGSAIRLDHVFQRFPVHEINRKKQNKNEIIIRKKTKKKNPKNREEFQMIDHALAHTRNYFQSCCRQCFILEEGGRGKTSDAALGQQREAEAYQMTRNSTLDGLSSRLE